MSTNYTRTFIEVAADCPVDAAVEPPHDPDKPSVAALQFQLLSESPHELTSDDVLFEVFATRRGIAAADRDAAREAFFAKDQACLRASPLAKRYGWGLLHDAESRVALVPLGSPEYAELAADDSVRHLAAMRSRRA